MGIHFLLGLSIAVGKTYSLIFVWLLLVLPFFLIKENQRQNFLKVVMGIVILILSFYYGISSKIEFPSMLETIEGRGLFSPSSVKIHHSPFYKSYVYKGTLKYFEGNDGEIGYHLPCIIYQSLQAKRPLAQSDFFLEGTLIKKESGAMLFQPHKNKTWSIVPHTFSWAEWRFSTKEKLHAYLEKHIKDPKALSFLYALCSGDIDERMLSFEFSKLGLQHILAISGFHFALLAGFCGYLLKKILPEIWALVILLILLSFYFFFLGSSPSVFRAWLAVFLWVMAQLLHRKTSALNALGVALIVELLCDPSTIHHLGFQLSFLSTAAILFLYPVTSLWLKKLLPQRSMKDIESFSFLDKCGYLICSLLRVSLALNIAVHLAAVPVCLFHFHKFPYLSLAYNLFFPFWAGLSLLFLLWASLFTALFPPVGEFLHGFNTTFTTCLLEITSNPPALLNFFASAAEIPFILLPLYLICLFYLAIGIDFRNKRDQFSL